MRTLNLSTGTFDRLNSFGIELPGFGGPRTRAASLHMGAKHSNDGILWVMQHSACIAARYSADEIAEKERIYRGEPPVRNGDTVIVNGKKYLVQIVGDYSNCAYLCPADYDFHGVFKLGKRSRKFKVKEGMVTTSFYAGKVTLTYAKFIETFHGRDAPVFLS